MNTTVEFKLRKYKRKKQIHPIKLYAFRDVQAARADMERSKNEAEAYANDVIPEQEEKQQKYYKLQKL